MLKSPSKCNKIPTQKMKADKDRAKKAKKLSETVAQGANSLCQYMELKKIIEKERKSLKEKDSQVKIMKMKRKKNQKMHHLNENMSAVLHLILENANSSVELLDQNISHLTKIHTKFRVLEFILRQSIRGVENNLPYLPFPSKFQKCSIANKYSVYHRNGVRRPNRLSQEHFIALQKIDDLLETRRTLEEKAYNLKLDINRLIESKIRLARRRNMLLEHQDNLIVARNPRNNSNYLNSSDVRGFEVEEQGEQGEQQLENFEQNEPESSIYMRLQSFFDSSDLSELAGILDLNPQGDSNTAQKYFKYIVRQIQSIMKEKDF